MRPLNPATWPPTRFPKGDFRCGFAHSPSSSPAPRRPRASPPAPTGIPPRARSMPTPASAATVYPTYRVPQLAGQHAAYIVQALKEYKAGERNHKTMHAQASSLSDQQMQDIAAYFESLG